MTDILPLSDLHQGEYGEPFDVAAIDRSFDVLVAAGDVAGRLTSSLRWLAERFPGVPTAYVPGNHDFYRDGGPDGWTVESELEDGAELADRLGIHLLHDRSVEIAGVIFHGATLWTDMRSRMHVDRGSAMRDARRGMNDYRRIRRRSSTRGTRRIVPQNTVAWHARSVDYLGRSLAENAGRTNVVVTHHAPSYHSLLDQSDGLNHCYASHMDAFVERHAPDLWIHGHVHRKSDYEIGRTRILANPWGYAGEISGFDPNLVVTVPSDPRPRP